MNELAPLDPSIFFSIVIPAYNEEKNIESTLHTIIKFLYEKKVQDFEILVINDCSVDRTEEILIQLEYQYPQLRHVNNLPPNGFGYAVRRGLENFKGLSFCLVMADLSDSPQDIYNYYRLLKEGHECVFGSRFIKGAKVTDYPAFKLILNRCANFFIKTLFGLEYNDFTNAFKAYRREVIEGLMPIIGCHFNLTVELPLKAIIRGYQYRTIPISWTNKRIGKSNLVIQEMGSRYLFIVLYAWLEKKLGKGDYKRRLKVITTLPAEEQKKKAS
ncbi:MAG: hypothetical protein A2X86_00100 [Bdellovibrionales bacterium GWA2_49_15]|nr:MAG: hypothetical protein A2X86_00100 [Bdellovibrionales bacterium GWA2_49_15]HAZ14443.1 hypothetical protein [Bdellovibrionales bacterium]